MRTAAIIMLLLVSSLNAEEKTVWDPKAEEVFNKFITAIGGYDKIEKIKSVRTVSTALVKPQNIEATTTTIATRDKLHFSSDVAGMKTVAVFDGKKAWTSDPFFGRKEIHGKDLFKYSSITLKAQYYPELFFEKIKYGGPSTFNGRKTEKLFFLKKGISPIVYYYDAESHLLIGREANEKTTLGEMRTKASLSDYKKSTSGMLYASKTTMPIAILNGSVTQTITTYVENEDVDNTLFNKPAPAKKTTAPAKTPAK